MLFLGFQPCMANSLDKDRSFFRVRAKPTLSKEIFNFLRVLIFPRALSATKFLAQEAEIVLNGLKGIQLSSFLQDFMWHVPAPTSILGLCALSRSPSLPEKMDTKAL